MYFQKIVRAQRKTWNVVSCHKIKTLQNILELQVFHYFLLDLVFKVSHWFPNLQINDQEKWPQRPLSVSSANYSHYKKM